MRKKMLFLALAMAAAAGALSAPRATAEGGFGCPICTTYADGSQCCVSCWCDGNGVPIACTNHYCPPADGGDGGLG
ncbi:MAG TPA: hypothetical protein VF173_30575 [Thermoanaerobaculia bacterium]|nr:hypothetical protein [Thermoanaerobaculia bacterium]